MTRHSPFREEEEIELLGLSAVNLAAEAPLREGLGPGSRGTLLDSGIARAGQQ
jgi:hypothetical protein